MSNPVETPCPFCGCIQNVVVEKPRGGLYVMCGAAGCGAAGPAESTSEEATTAWRSRVYVLAEPPEVLLRSHT